MLAALRCPECTAPVRELPRSGGPASCAYCGAALAITTPSGRMEARFWVVLRVGPSNLDRVARVLEDHLGAGAADARARLEQPPCEIAVGSNELHAHEVARAAAEAGAHADVISRDVLVPFRTVILEDAGERKLAVIAALRAEVDLTVPEAKRFVASAPCVIATGVEEADARALVAALGAAGARASSR